MFVDEVKVYVVGGQGGAGCSSTLRQKYIPRGGPDGGNGGRGGDVVLVATHDQNTLAAFSRHRHFRARPGSNGSSNNKFGRHGDPREVLVPLGTVVQTEDGDVLADLVLPGERFVAAHGGRGGRGNAALARPANPVPRYAEKGEPGEERWLYLELKLLADVALVGFPNVGKSTLISALSAARPKIADYPFTTTAPHLGVVTVDEGHSFVLADVPGLIEGAHQGKGLGTRFLRHIERCRAIVHLLDLSGWESRDPAADYRAIRRELAAYSAELAKKPELIAGNKLDVPGAADRLAAVKRRLRKRVHGLSAVTGQGVKELIRGVADLLAGLPAEVRREQVVHRFASEPDLTVARAGRGRYAVTGKRVERLVAMTDLRNAEAVEVLARKLRRLGVEEELSRAGAEPGDTVCIGRHEFSFEPEE
ncbi:MAG: GTPase ObgE [Candidatus Riflebacteria bacterium]|nr:GTPase ObgE [Candidatus Riflebacteria bacterium]